VGATWPAALAWRTARSGLGSLECRSSRRDSPAKLSVGLDTGSGSPTPAVRWLSTSRGLAWVLRRAFLVLECVRAFFERNDWLKPVREAFQCMGYGVYVRKEQASDYLAQTRLRGLLILVKADYWDKAEGPLRDLFTGSPAPRYPTPSTERVLGPDVQPGHRGPARGLLPLQLSEGVMALGRLSPHCGRRPPPADGDAVLWYRRRNLWPFP